MTNKEAMESNKRNGFNTTRLPGGEYLVNGTDENVTISKNDKGRWMVKSAKPIFEGDYQSTETFTGKALALDYAMNAYNYYLEAEARIEAEAHDEAQSETFDPEEEAVVAPADKEGEADAWAVWSATVDRLLTKFEEEKKAEAEAEIIEEITEADGEVESAEKTIQNIVYDENFISAPGLYVTLTYQCKQVHKYVNQEQFVKAISKICMVTEEEVIEAVKYLAYKGNRILQRVFRFNMPALIRQMEEPTIQIEPCPDGAENYCTIFNAQQLHGLEQLLKRVPGYRGTTYRAGVMIFHVGRDEWESCVYSTSNTTWEVELYKNAQQLNHIKETTDPRKVIMAQLEAYFFPACLR